MENLSLHILDIAENSIRAGAKKIEVQITEDTEKDLLTICICDDGKGMDKQELDNVRDPFYTTKGGKKFGLGLSLLSQASQQTEGTLTIQSEMGQGTKVIATFKPSHPDMKPMGEIFETLAVLITGHPEIRFIYDYKKGTTIQHFDSCNV